MREKIDFCKDWIFHEGDINGSVAPFKGITYMEATFERKKSGAAAKDYHAEVINAPDSYDRTVCHTGDIWIPVELPYDYIIHQVPKFENGDSLGFFKYNNAWLRKTFTLTKEDLTKRITIYFEGITQHSTVYVNGCLVKRNYCGYSPFEVDITDVMLEGKNVLAVYIDAGEHEGWWYEGGGIYRNVYMIKTEKVAVDLYGVYVKPTLIDKTWNLNIETTLLNANHTSKSVEIKQEVSDEENKCVLSLKGSTEILADDKGVIKLHSEIDDVNLWSPDTPYLYKVKTEVFVSGEKVDEVFTTFGFRSYYVDKDEGLFINGKHYEIKGVCGHADSGLFGKAVPDNIHRYKVQLMKEMGANGYRTSHYPQAEALMDEFDKQGFIVMDETRWFTTSKEGLEQLETLIKRDRNRPSVFFWSIGNEEVEFATERGKNAFKKLYNFAKKLDDSRLITAAVNMPENCTIFDDVDIVAINYNWGAYDGVREKYPNKAFLSSENCATGTTRGWYCQDEPTKAYLYAYDRDTNVDFKSRESTWKFITERKYIVGGYQWIAFEHRGEATWPRLCSQSGAIDLFMQKKDAFYQNKSFWTDKPMVHLMPHWNFEGLEGEEFLVRTYTNAEEVELFLNGKSLGKKEVERYGKVEWQVKYERGNIKAVAYIGGKEVAVDEKITAGKGYRLKLIQDTFDISRSGKDVSIITCIVEDEKGNEIPNAEVEVSFNTEGNCEIYSTGSDISEHDTIFKSTRKMRAGRISVAVKIKEGEGDLYLYARSYGLNSAKLKIQTK